MIHDMFFDYLKLWIETLTFLLCSRMDDGRKKEKIYTIDTYECNGVPITKYN